MIKIQRMCLLLNYNKLLQSRENSLQFRHFSLSPNLLNYLFPKRTKKNNGSKHCYNNLFPWKDFSDFEKELPSCIVYNKNGLIALNKPSGIKIHGHDKPGARSSPGQRKFFPTLEECDYTIEDALDYLKDFLNVPTLSIVKSAEKYTSGLVLLGTDEKVKDDVRKAFDLAKMQKRLHLTHWMITLGNPVTNFKKERVGIKFVQLDGMDNKQPILLSEFSKNAVKRKEVYPVNVEYRVISANRKLQTSLVEVTSSSLRFHFCRLYASLNIASILGDSLYSSRSSTFMGAPIKLHLHQAQGFGLKPLPNEVSEVLMVPKGVEGHSKTPLMLHLRSILLPCFRGKEDCVVTAEPPKHFDWTLSKLNLMTCNK